MKFGNRTLAYLLTVTLMMTVMSGTTAAASEKLDEWKSPQEAVSEMTWGVNLSDLYITDVPYHDGYPVGYYDFSSVSSAEFEFAAWFWDTTFVGVGWGLHNSTFSVSIPFPNYTQNSADWIGGLFTLGILGGDELKDLSVTLSDSKITKNGETVGDISFLDCTYPLNSNIQSNSNNNNTYWLWLGGQNTDDDNFSSRLPAPSPELNGAIFETTVTLSSTTSMTKEEKADHFFQYQRTAMAPEELTDLFLDQGANVVRLPVTWTPFINDQTFEIDEAWLKKVQVEVDYLLSQGAYCILDMHNDYLGRSFVGVSDGNGGWTDLHWENEWMYGKYKEYVDARYAAVWEQIATYFKDYPQKLILESFNEPVMDYIQNPPLWDSSSYGHPFDEEVARVNELNQLFVDTVRTTGGNNSKRLLCVAPANYNQHTMLESFRFTLPKTNGKVDENLIVQLHSYSAMEVNGDGTFNPNFDYVSGTKALFDDVEEFWSRYPDVPILIGEVGVAHNGTDEQLAQRVAHYFAEAEKRDIPCLWWEDYFTGNPAVQYWLYDKAAQEWARPQILQAIKDALGITSLDVTVNVNGTSHSFTNPFHDACTVYASIYDEDGKLLAVSSADKSDRNAVNLSMTVANLPEAYSVKVFLLDSASFRPLTEALQ